MNYKTWLIVIAVYTTGVLNVFGAYQIGQFAGYFPTQLTEDQAQEIYAQYKMSVVDANKKEALAFSTKTAKGKK